MSPKLCLGGWEEVRRSVREGSMKGRAACQASVARFAVFGHRTRHRCCCEKGKSHCGEEGIEARPKKVICFF